MRDSEHTTPSDHRAGPGPPVTGATGHGDPDGVRVLDHPHPGLAHLLPVLPDDAPVTPFGLGLTVSELMRELTTEIGDDAYDLLCWRQKHGLDAQYDMLLGRLKGRVDLLYNIRFVLSDRGTTLLDRGRDSI